MKIVDRGHVYLLQDNKKSSHSNKLIFFKDAEINKKGFCGTTNQEVLRCLIDRIFFLNGQQKCQQNNEIIFHLRKALILHEQRHLDRLVQKGLKVEDLKVFKDGHIVKCHAIKQLEDTQ